MTIRKETKIERRNVAHLANITIQIPKPRPQPLIILRISTQLINSAQNPLNTLPAREPLQQRPQLTRGTLERWVLGNGAGFVGVVRGESTAVADVLFGGGDEPGEGFLVVFVVLAFDYYFFEAVDPLRAQASEGERKRKQDSQFVLKN